MALANDVKYYILIFVLSPLHYTEGLAFEDRRTHTILIYALLAFSTDLRAVKGGRPLKKKRRRLSYRNNFRSSARTRPTSTFQYFSILSFQRERGYLNFCSENFWASMPSRHRRKAQKKEEIFGRLNDSEENFFDPELLLIPHRSRIEMTV